MLHWHVEELQSQRRNRADKDSISIPEYRATESRMTPKESLYIESRFFAIVATFQAEQ